MVLPISIAITFVINFVIAVYFCYLWRADQEQSCAFNYWFKACLCFCGGIFAHVVGAQVPSLPIFNLLGSLAVFTSSYLLFCGIRHFSLVRLLPKTVRSAKLLFFVGCALITLSALVPQLSNALASIAMAIMFLFCDGAIKKRNYPSYLQPLLGLRITLKAHAFVLFFQGAVLLLNVFGVSLVNTQQLSELALVSHLLLAVITAVLLPFLCMSAKKHRWEKVANEDELTRVLRRHAFIKKSLNIIKQAPRNSASLLMVDIDYFKAVNDEHGHLAGDEVLRQIAATLKSEIRSVDLIGRLGGEEFAILMPGLSADKAHRVAERLLKKVAEVRVEYAGRQIQSTVSIGIAESTGVLYSWRDLFGKADSALYSAKHKGRNLVLTYPGTR